MKESLKQKEWKKNEFQNNKEKYRIKQQERRKDIRELIESLKKSCVVCGETEKSCIDFHHINPEEKDFAIAAVTQRKWSNRRIIKEVEKCVCLCANHHRILHYYNFTVDEIIEKYKII